MSEKANDVLITLLQKGQLDQTRSRDITLPASRIKGYPFEDVVVKRDFHAMLKLAEEKEAIKVEWRRYFENEEILRLRLLDPKKLAEFLNIDYLPDQLETIFNNLDLTECPVWLKESFVKLREQFAKGKKAFGLGLEDADKLVDIVSAVKALNDGLLESEPLDYRQFGARYLNNSKRTKDIERALSALYQQHWRLSDWRPQDVLSQLNLVPLSHPVLLHGPIYLSDGQQTLTAELTPYIGVPVKMLSEVSILKQPKYILTIENLSSFNEYTSQIRDDGVIIYTAGFPNSALQRFYKKLVQCDAPIFHWGDTDPHGFMILKVLQKEVDQKVVNPHLMDIEQAAEYSSAQLKSLQRLKPVNPTVDKLLDKILDRGTGCVEQESVAPRAPSLFGNST